MADSNVPARTSGGASQRMGDFNFREATDADYPAIEALFADQYSVPGWATWKFGANPDGVSRVFVADEGDDDVVGTIAHVARRFTSRDTGEFLAYQAADVLVRGDVRQQGVFLRLLHYSQQRMSGPRFGLPNAASRAFGNRLGWEELEPHENWHFPVRVGGRKALPPAVANAVSRIYARLRLSGRPKGIEMRPLDRFVADYALDGEKIHGIRSAAYLNWRFIENPLFDYAAFEFAEDGESIGYCVLLASDDGVVNLVDFVAHRSMPGCLRLLIDHCWELDAVRVTFRATGLNLTRYGFRRGRHYRTSCIATQIPPGRWLITACDTDAAV